MKRNRKSLLVVATILTMLISMMLVTICSFAVPAKITQPAKPTQPTQQTQATQPTQPKSDGPVQYTLPSGHLLRNGDVMRNGPSVLRLVDGKLSVEYDELDNGGTVRKVFWSSAAGVGKIDHLTMEKDGNLRGYDAKGKNVISFVTDLNAPGGKQTLEANCTLYFLQAGVLQVGHRIVLGYYSHNEIVKGKDGKDTAKVYTVPTYRAIGNDFTVGQSIYRFQYLLTKQKKYCLLFTPDFNFALYSTATKDGKISFDKCLWDIKGLTKNEYCPYMVTMEKNGDFVFYCNGNKKLVASSGINDAGTKVSLSDNDGYLYFVKPNGDKIKKIDKLIGSVKKEEFQITMPKNTTPKK